MLCPKCGANIENSYSFCSECGCGINNAATETPVSDTPEPTPFVANIPKMRKGKYIRKEGSKKVKALAGVVWGVFAAIIIVLALSVNAVISNSIIEIPVVKMVVPETQTANILESIKGVDELLDQADEVLDEVKNDIPPEEYKVIKNVLNDVKSFAENQSIANTKNVVNSLAKASKIAEKYPEHEKLSEHFEVANFAEEIAEPMKLFDVAIYAFIGFAGFILLITLLAVAIKSSGFAIFGLILSELLCYFLAGPVYAITTALLYLALVVMFIIINTEYRKYKKSL